MHVHLPKPLHGWRAFAGEVGIIVVGVLIALGAEQIVHDIANRADEQAFEETINHEIGLNLFVYHLRAWQFACDERRAGELTTWLAQARSGKDVPPLRPTGPVIIAPYRSAWDNRDGQVFNHLTVQRRQKYAEFYDELSNNWSIIKGEQEQWASLVPYAEPGPISLTDRRTIRPILTKIGNANATLQGNVPISLKIAAVLQVKEVEPDNLPRKWRTAPECRSVIQSPSQAAK